MYEIDPIPDVNDSMNEKKKTKPTQPAFLSQAF